jgi:hypothetical protein
MGGRDLVTINNVTVIRSTDKAGLYRFEDGSEHWLPWSQVEDGSVDRDGRNGKVIIPQWLAEKLELEEEEED